MSSTEGHECDNCGCGMEHGCVCGWCDKDESYFYDDTDSIHTTMT